MITDLQIQHELLKTALEATDNYLFVEKRAIEQGMATNHMVHDFTYEMSRAHDALQALGVLDQHQDYMEKHVETMLKLHGHKDRSIEDIPYSHVPMADTGEVEESRIKSFSNFIVEKKSDEITEEEIDQMVESLTWEDIIDLYDDSELIYEKEDDEEPEDEDEKELEEDFLDEKLSVQARIKKRQAFTRTRGKRNTARNIKLRRASSTEVLKKRAVLAARRAVYKRILRGRDKASLSAAEKDRIEQQVARMKYLQTSIALKMMPKMRSIEQKRLASYRNPKSKAPKLTKVSKAPGGTKR